MKNLFIIAAVFASISAGTSASADTAFVQNYIESNGCVVPTADVLTVYLEDQNGDEEEFDALVKSFIGTGEVVVAHGYNNDREEVEELRVYNDACGNVDQNSILIFMAFVADKGCNLERSDFSTLFDETDVKNEEIDPYARHLMEIGGLERNGSIASFLPPYCTAG